MTPGLLQSGNWKRNICWAFFVVFIFLFTLGGCVAKKQSSSTEGIVNMVEEQVTLFEKRGTFEQIGNMNEKRFLPSLQQLEDGRVLIFGGAFRDPIMTEEIKPGGLKGTHYEYPLDNADTFRVDIFDPKNNEISKHEVKGKPKLFLFNNSAQLPNGNILVAGKNLILFDTKKMELVDLKPVFPFWQDVEILKKLEEDPKSHKQIAEYPPAYYHPPSLTLLKSGKVLIAGGMGFYYSIKDNNREPNTKYLNLAFIYDPETNDFQPTGNLKCGRSDHQATLLQNGKVLITGGEHTSQGCSYMGNNPNGYFDNSISHAEIYDPETGKFTAIEHMTIPRQGHTATLLNTGEVLITGGESNNLGDEEIDDSSQPGRAYKITGCSIPSLSSAELFDPKTNTFTTLPDMNKSRIYHTATLLQDGTILIAGGGKNASCYNALRETEVFMPTQRKFIRATDLSENRCMHSAMLLKDGTVFIAEGRDFKTYLNTAERFIPTR